MTHETAPAGQKSATSGCCGGMAKDKAPAPATVKSDVEPAAGAMQADKVKTGSSCC